MTDFRDKLAPELALCHHPVYTHCCGACEERAHAFARRIAYEVRLVEFALLDGDDE